ncbi:hypothetical protein [Streptomyces asiaticus]|uniref:hypothetical protein n=1 Tax=Streptomyces asiaticus TaxID=114695 RepID=UPI00380911B0
MLQCTAVAALPHVETLAELVPCSARPEAIAAVEPYAVCELSEEHEGDHADHLLGDNPALWFLWDDS